MWWHKMKQDKWSNTDWTTGRDHTISTLLQNKWGSASNRSNLLCESEWAIEFEISIKCFRHVLFDLQKRDILLSEYYWGHLPPSALCLRKIIIEAIKSIYNCILMKPIQTGQILEFLYGFVFMYSIQKTCDLH